MNSRGWMLFGFFIALGLGYVVFFTEWLSPAPIEIASQVRFTMQPPRFGRPAKKPAQPAQPAIVIQPGQQGDQVVQGTPGQSVRLVQIKTNKIVNIDPIERVGQPEKGTIDQAPGGVANVTFSLDGIYQLTRLRVEDVPADGTAPRVMWQLVGKSRPLNSLHYSHDPEGMKPILEGSTADLLLPGVPYRLIVEVGRRRGTNNFMTTAVQSAE